MDEVKNYPVIDTANDMETNYSFVTHKEKYGTSPTQEDFDKRRKELGNVYEVIIKILKKYCDLEEKYYSLVALWIIGTYSHNQFPTYPYLFFNAMKGSGKSRLLRLITYLSKEGCMLNSLTEAVLFRTTGTLGIDEFEGLNRKGKENLTELLNSAYKKGIKVKRMKKVKKFDGEEQVVEEFEVYRPIVLANISGMDSVLSDRCFTIILNKSCKPEIVKRVELFESDEDIHFVKNFFAFLSPECSKCSVDVVLRMYNSYLDNIYTNTINTITTLTTLSKEEEKYIPFFNRINDTGIDGRNLELSMPLLILADSLNEDILNELFETLKTFIDEKKKEDVVENLDISLIDFISQEPPSDLRYISIREIFNSFKNSIGLQEDWFNEKWMGRALKRLNLITEKKRLNFGVVVKLDYNKAQEKIRMFK